TSLG
ncbi:hypothetical protein ECNE1487_4701, partial [Escherichia coli NE1487]